MKTILGVSVLVLALAACGGGGDEKAEVTEVTETVTTNPTESATTTDPTVSEAPMAYRESDECAAAIEVWVTRAYSPLADPMLDYTIAPSDLTTANARAQRFTDPVLAECSPQVNVLVTRANLNLNLAAFPFELTPPATEVGQSEFDLALKAMTGANKALNRATGDRP